MSLTSRLLSIGMSIALIVMIFCFVRRGKLKEKYALTWIITSMIILFFAVFDKALVILTNLLGIKTPANMMFFLGIFFVIIIILNLSLVISGLVEQNKLIAQKIGLLENEIVNLKEEKCVR